MVMQIIPSLCSFIIVRGHGGALVFAHVVSIIADENILVALAPSQRC
jgi:hypothetical protein